MNAIVQHSGQPAALPTIPDPIRRLIQAATPMRFGGHDPRDPGAGMVVGPSTINPSREQIAEANRILAVYDSQAPVSFQTAWKWLFALNGAVANPQGEDAFKIRMTAFRGILSDYPEAVFSQDALHEAMRTFEFFPSVAKLAELLDRRRAELRATTDGLRRIASHGRAAGEPDTARHDEDRRDPVQQQAVTDLLAAWRGEQNSRHAAEAAEAAKSRPIAKATPVNDELLLAIHEAEARKGNRASAIRASALRRKLGLEQQETRV